VALRVGVDDLAVEAVAAGLEAIVVVQRVDVALRSKRPVGQEVAGK